MVFIIRGGGRGGWCRAGKIGLPKHIVADVDDGVFVEVGRLNSFANIVGTRVRLVPVLRSRR